MNNNDDEVYVMLSYFMPTWEISDLEDDDQIA